MVFLSPIPPHSPVPPAEEPAIIVTASREAVPVEEVAVSATILDLEAITSLSSPSVPDLLRLVPGLSVSSSGPRGSQAQVRIRGAEANHTLLYLDGIRFNDPAAGNEARFELLGTDLLERIEVVRGPQSALWGSEAVGGVVAAQTVDPLRRPGAAGQAEYGSHETLRVAGQAGQAGDALGVSLGAAFQRSEGFDSFGESGDRDGFWQLASRVKAVMRRDGLELGAVGHWIEGLSEFDGVDPVSFRRADTLDATRNRIAAGRIWGRLEQGNWSFEADAQWLDSVNRNRIAGREINATFGDRIGLGAQLARRAGDHLFVLAAEGEREGFQAHDRQYAGATAQNRSRSLLALVGQWRARWTDVLSTDLAVRHDRFSAFADAVTFRAAALARLSRPLSLHAAYGEGIAQPSFYDLHGFFPGSFVGNPSLQPEKARNVEIGMTWRQSGWRVELTGFTGRLTDEIVDIFDPVTFLSSTANAEGRSRRRGLEAEISLAPSPEWDVSVSYSFIDSAEPKVERGLVREIRRARHSLSLLAQGRRGRLGWGASLAWIGARRDMDFEAFPARRVRLGDYLLGHLTLSWRLAERLEIVARVENVLDEAYQDVFGYRTPGRAVHAGLRLPLLP